MDYKKLILDTVYYNWECFETIINHGNDTVKSLTLTGQDAINYKNMVKIYTIFKDLNINFDSMSRETSNKEDLLCCYINDTCTDIYFKIIEFYRYKNIKDILND